MTTKKEKIDNIKKIIKDIQKSPKEMLKCEMLANSCDVREIKLMNKSFRLGKSEAIKQVIKIIEEIEHKPSSNSITQYNPYVFSEQLKSKIGELAKEQFSGENKMKNSKVFKLEEVK